MQPTLCARCGKNMAVVFITRIENNESHNEGLCLKCARALHIKPVDDVMERMGLTDEDLDNITGDMQELLRSAEDLADLSKDEDGENDDGKTATFPFLNRLFGANGSAMQPAESEPQRAERPKTESGKEAPKKRKFLDSSSSTVVYRTIGPAISWGKRAT